MMQSPAVAVDKVVVVPFGSGAIGNATAVDVVKGKTFSSKAGKGLVGTLSVPYLDSGNGTIIDTATGLMWQQADDGNTYSWDAAVAHCQTLHFPQTGGYDDWRLPTKDELKGLVRCSNVTETPLCDDGVCTPDHCGDGTLEIYDSPTIYDALEASRVNYWSKTDISGGGSSAWAVSFRDGKTTEYVSGLPMRVRCVR